MSVLTELVSTMVANSPSQPELKTEAKKDAALTVRRKVVRELNFMCVIPVV